MSSAKTQSVNARSIDARIDTRYEATLGKYHRYYRIAYIDPPSLRRQETKSYEL